MSSGSVLTLETGSLLSRGSSQAEIHAVFDRVHQQTLEELQGLDESELDKTVLNPHSLVKTKLWALLWCAYHETLHAGQIGLLRRQLGYAPLR